MRLGLTAAMMFHHENRPEKSDFPESRDGGVGREKKRLGEERSNDARGLITLGKSRKGLVIAKSFRIASGIKKSHIQETFGKARSHGPSRPYRTTG